ncbi:laminin subunit alpha-like isoform X2 [Littorina saxatilis]|uniref:Laminin subunit alpha n=1 Tax=Littorina saxatilis TaxID=31220 RepID=A0AAN9BA63_9CAEN
MARRDTSPVVAAHFTMTRLLCLQTWILMLMTTTTVKNVNAQVLTPPYFNLAQGKNITATATCGVDVPRPELFCRLTGATGSEDQTTREVIRGQLCDYCYPDIPQQDHRAIYAVDGTERWWQSPPLSRGVQYNKVNLTVHLGQEFHVAYVFIRMANSPRPGVWVLERSIDYGKTWNPWQFFADTPSDCNKFFEAAADESIYFDDQVLCTTQFSKVVPLEGGEIVVSLVNGRPSAENFSNTDILQEWTKATDIQLRFIRTKTLLGHLMAVARQDPTVTRRYYYSIKDISIGGRCVCNGHANSCDRPPGVDGFHLTCACEHNTCGDQCDQCCPGFVQKRWRRNRSNDPFVCEPCECYGHTNECVFDEAVESDRRSIDIHGNYEGGGVCQNCQQNTMGINCEQCIPTFYRPYSVERDDPTPCRPCECDLRVSTGECEEGSGRCLCRPEYAGVTCDRCNIGYYGYPDCIPCDCHINGTEDSICTVTAGSCPCKENYDGRKCDMCALGYYNFPECQTCECNPIGSIGQVCDRDSGQCTCTGKYGTRDCGACADGYFEYPTCAFCSCDPAGTEDEICNKASGACLCKQNFTGARCDRCEPGFYGFPDCKECQCQEPGSLSTICGDSGQCSCKANFAGLNCGRCAAGYYRYPDCVPCQCDLYGSLSVTCNQISGQCSCRDNFEGQMCERCREKFYNYPICEICNCNPSGSKEIPGYPLGGCGIVTPGLLCDCRENVQGKICDQCKPGYWFLNRNNREGCQECTCFKPGTLTGSNVCNTESGQCMCKPDVGSRDCDTCRDGYFNLQQNNPFGCTNCMCNMGGSHTPVCNKMTGQCRCRPRVTGIKCDQPIKSHFYPDLHQLQFEIEDGVTPEGYRVRYGYDETVFPDYSWRGYAITTDVQPEVQMEVNIKIPSLYRIIYRYVNRNDKTIRGEVTLKPESDRDTIQTGTLLLPPSLDPRFATVTSGAVSAFVLNPGRWTISTKIPDISFLDYFVLIPQDFYEATVLQQQVTSPCEVPGDPGPCLHYQYPDLVGYPFVPGIEGYNYVDQERVKINLYPDSNVTTELGTKGLGHLNPDQTSFTLDLVVPDKGLYVLVVAYHNPTNRSQEIDVDVASLAGKEDSKLMLHSCKYSSLCRQVFMTPDGRVGVYNISTGYVSLTFTGPKDVDIGIDTVFAIPYNEWTTEFIRPRIICIRINGICIISSYSVPVGTMRIDFELPPNHRTIVVPTSLLDPNVGLVQLNETDREIEIRGTVDKPGQYVILFHHYMPTEIGLTIPVTVYVGGQVIEGLFKPTYCPSVTGCRGAIMFGSGNLINLKDNDIRILVTNRDGGKIWLDYALIVPSERYTPFDLVLQPIDRSGDFLTQCVDEGFRLKSDEEFCKDSTFTLTTEFNKGAVQCDCNVDGSLNFNCESFGGQCQCRENVIGRTCSACRPDFYGYPNCRPCNCPFGVCHPITGDCICPPRVEGDRCDRCASEAYGYDALIGCQECKCNPRGADSNNLNCDQTTGECNCMPNVGGRKCDTCLPGHHSFPYCRRCDCDPAGTEEEICDQVTSQCLCKSNVLGQRCDQCPEGSFHLSADNPTGCTRCFCFGTTTRCTSSALAWDLVSSMDGWQATNMKEDGYVIEAGNTIAVKAAGNTLDISEAIYWVAPDAYLGNKINSYGGKLIFGVLFILPEDEETEGLYRPDVILVGNNMTVTHYHPRQPQNRASMVMEIPLYEYNFQHKDTGAEVSREQFMMILINLEAMHIRASYYTRVDETRLSEVSMEHATETGAGEPANTVERCQCPYSYQGSSCQECAPGNYRSRSSPYLGICISCNCNRHSDNCDVNTGECFNCGGNTTGPNCEQCLPGYYGDPSRGPCQICSCPLPLASNNFATECRLAEDGLRTYCTCIPGYYGPTCESCAPGYYGNPREVGSYCQPCGCSGNIDVTNFRACDRFSGACLLCQNNTSGANCEMCEDWYWGDAVGRKDCAACDCDICGSESCDKNVGVCNCKPNVVGSECDQCASNTWGYEYCTGCRDCDCGMGSVSPQCDLRTGSCECQPGVQGAQCDKCLPGHWNLGPNGCQECNCLTDGAVGCDDQTGRCNCLPGVTGTMCDRCLDRWVLVPGQGCQECDYCIHLLLDDLDVLDRNVTTVRRQLADVSVGVAAFNRLAQYNNTLIELQPRVADLYSLDQDEMQDMMDPLKDRLDTVESDARDTLDKANQGVARAEQQQDSIEALTTDASDTEILIREQVVMAENAVQFVKQILGQILASIKVTNIERYIIDAEGILDGISTRNFTVEDVKALLELENAKALLGVVDQLGEKVEAELNRTIDTEVALGDILERLLDLGKNTETNAALMALDDLRRLRAQNMEVLEDLTEVIETLEKDSLTLLDTGRQLLEDAEEALANATTAFDELAVDSSKMEQALVDIMGHYDNLGRGLNDLEPLVNRTFAHAEALHVQASELDNLYNNTRDLSANAVAAGQAYKNIVKFINAAHNNSQEAVDDADTALNETNGNAENARESYIMSDELLGESEILFDKTRNELLSNLTASKTETDDAQTEKDKVAEVLNEIQEELDALDDGSASLRSQNVIDKSDVTSQKGVAAGERVDRIITLLPEDQKKLESINPDRIEAVLNMKNTESNVETVRQSRPEIVDLLKPLQANATRLIGVGESLDVNVKALKEKIELAREQANRIRVGLKFLGNTTVTARNPPQLDQAGSYTQLSLYFKTSQADALLAYVGGQRRAENLQNDFISLELRGGRVVFQFNLGAGPAIIASSRSYADGQWHQAVVERIGKSGTLIVRSDKQADDVNDESSPSTFTVLELNPATTSFYLGGVPDDVSIPIEVSRRPLVGSMEDVKFDETPVGLWNFEDAENTYMGEFARDVMKEIVTNGMRFNGMGYVVLSRDKLSLRPKKTDIQLQFQTYSENGLLVYASDNKRDFLSIELKEGRVVFQYDLGGGSVLMESAGKLNDGEWHSVTISRSQQEGLLRVDEIVTTGMSKGSLSELSTTADIFVGGFDQILVPVGNVGSYGFDGCIRDMKYGTIAWDLNDNERAKGVVRGCPAKVARIATFKEVVPVGFIAFNLDEPIGSKFDMTFKMRTNLKEAVMVYVADDTQDNAFSVGVMDGKIMLKSVQDEGSVELISRVNTYSDGNWHYISVMKDGLTFEMNIDDYEMLQRMSETGTAFLETSTPLYFGSVPPDFKIKEGAAVSDKTFIGCIGDITVQRKFVNLASIPESQRQSIQLVECPIKSDEEMEETEKTDASTVAPGLLDEMTTRDPDQCMLPLEPKIMEDAEVEDGVRFGSRPHSRLEFTRLPARMRIRSQFTLSFKTSGQNGLLFYVADTKHIDFLGLYMVDGQLHFGFNCGSGAAKIVSSATYNDDTWHEVSFGRQQRSGTLMVDGDLIGRAKSLGSTRSINVNAPYFVGGLSELAKNKSLGNVGDGWVSFPGCIRDVKLRTLPLSQPSNEIDIQKCSNAFELGTFFKASGGYLQLFDRFKVGRDLDISIDVRPRTQSGVLLAVHGRMDYLVLQIVEGQVIFTTDNGAGAITAIFPMLAKNSLCDGNWHTIKANKNKTVVTLVVNGKRGQESVGSTKVSAADTNDPLYIGGLPDTSLKGVQTNEQYVGCIRNLEINNKPQPLFSGTVIGDVEIDSCPAS